MKDILSLLIDYLKFLKPKAHNAITKILIFAGIALIAPTFITTLINAILEKELKISIINESDPLIGLFIIVIALIYNLLFNIITSPSKELLTIEFDNNSLWLHYEGTKRIELFSVHLKIFELCEKEEFKNYEQMYFQTEKIINNEQNVELFSISNSMKKSIGLFYNKIGLTQSHPLQSIGIEITVHYNTVGLIRRKHITFKRWITKIDNDNYIIHKHAYHYEDNKPHTDKIIEGLKKVLTFVASPISEYRRISMMRLAQKKLNFESYVRAYMNDKLTESELLFRIKKEIGFIKSGRTKEELLYFANVREFYEILPHETKKILNTSKSNK